MEKEDGLSPTVVFPLQQLVKMTNLGTAQGFHKEGKHLFD